MSPLAAITVETISFISWLLVGAIAGWLAGLVLKAGGLGLIGDMIVGLLGAVIGGFLFGQASSGQYGFVGSTVVAFIGACILIGVVRFVTPKRTQV